MIAWRLCAVLALMSNVAGAAQWTVLPQVTLGANYQDNPKLVLKDAQAVGAASLDARAVLTAAGEATQFSATPRVSAIRYQDFAP